MRSVSGSECVVYVYFSHRSERLGEIGIVLLFCRVETNVFKKQNFAVFESGGFRLRVGTDNVFCKNCRYAVHLESVGNYLKREFGNVVFRLFESGCLCGFLLGFGESFDFLLLFLVESEFFVKNVVRTSHVRAKDDLRAFFHKVLDGRKRADYSLFVGDDAVLYRNVEVAANEYAFARYFYVFDCLFVVVHSCSFP